MTANTPRLDAIIIGGGFAGIYALHRLRGMGMSVRLLEAGSGVGGTWFWNRYPGARCDIESMQYSYSFSDEIQQDWRWSELYASQSEILAYLNHVVDRLHLRQDILLETHVSSAEFDEGAATWTVHTASGEAFTARWCIMATGSLSVPVDPEIGGFRNFEGALYRTFDWRAEAHSFAGKRVGLVGTGSSGIQVMPHLAQQADELHVFQRTPNFIVPSWNRPMDDDYEGVWKTNYAKRRALARQTRNNSISNASLRSGLEFTSEQVRAELESRWAQGGTAFMYAFSDTTTSPRVNAIVSDFVREKIREVVTDAAKAEALTPKGYPIGAKRLCVGTDYYRAFNADHVHLHDLVADPVVDWRADGPLHASGRHVALDALVLATGFDALTGALARIDIRGRNGQELAEVWKDGPLTYLGLMVSGFPNMFIVAGPQSPSVFTNFVPSIEQHVDWIAEAIGHVAAAGGQVIEATPEAQCGWRATVDALAGASMVGTGKSNSWYVGANVPGKPRVVLAYLGGADQYHRVIEQVAKDNYAGFEMR